MRSNGRRAAIKARLAELDSRHTELEAALAAIEDESASRVDEPAPALRPRFFPPRLAPCIWAVRPPPGTPSRAAVGSDPAAAVVGSGAVAGA